MSFNEQISFQLYPDSSALTFTISDFYFVRPEYIQVTVYTPAGGVINKVQPTDWTIDGKTIERTPAAWEAGEVLVTRGNLYNQLNTWRNAEIDFDRELMEWTMDYITMLTQQNQDLYRKAIHAPLFDTANWFELPIVAVRAGKFMTFDGNGDLVVRELDSSDVGAANISWLSTFTNYSTNWVVSYLDKLWVAIAPVIGSAPGVVLGEWELSSYKWSKSLGWITNVVYSVGDVSLYDGKLWIAAAPVTTSSPGAVLGEWEEVAKPAAFTNTAESPVYGTPLIEGELFLDGTKDYSSSEGRKPVVDVVDYLPSIINIDGEEVNEANSKWPGKRGTYGFFGEYENDVSNSASVSSGVVTEEGSWSKLTASATGVNTYARVGAPTVGDTSLFMSVKMRHGDIVNSPIYNDGRIVLFVDSSPVGVVTIDWDTPGISVTGGAVDEGSFFIDSETVVIKCSSTFTAVTSAANSYIRLEVVDTDAQTTSGDYVYYKDWILVWNIDYPVPYHPGTHPAAKLQYDFDWAASDTWTIEGWIDLTNPITTTLFPTVLTNKNTNGANAISIFYATGSNVLNAKYHTLTAVSGAIIRGQWNHFKVTISSTEITMMTNGSGTDTETHAIDIDALDKRIYLGTSVNAGTDLFNGYIQDLRIYAGSDVTTTHYDDGLPYYNPEKTYGKDASWSIDSRGNISGLPQVSGVIIFDKEIDGQQITKWDTGLMMITTLHVASATVTTASGAMFTNPNSEASTELIWAVPFIDANAIVQGCARASAAVAASNPFGVTADHMYVKHISAVSFTGSVDMFVTAIGRWK